jgi:hypothetical protein
MSPKIRNIKIRATLTIPKEYEVITEADVEYLPKGKEKDYIEIVKYALAKRVVDDNKLHIKVRVVDL